jgi:hypothetical protein
MHGAAAASPVPEPVVHLLLWQELQQYFDQDQGNDDDRAAVRLLIHDLVPVYAEEFVSVVKALVQLLDARLDLQVPRQAVE